MSDNYNKTKNIDIDYYIKTVRLNNLNFFGVYHVNGYPRVVVIASAFNEILSDTEVEEADYNPNYSSLIKMYDGTISLLFWGLNETLVVNHYSATGDFVGSFDTGVAYQLQRIACCEIGNGNLFIAYYDINNSLVGQYIFVDVDNLTKLGPYVFYNGIADVVTACRLEDGQVIFLYVKEDTAEYETHAIFFDNIGNYLSTSFLGEYGEYYLTQAPCIAIPNTNRALIGITNNRLIICGIDYFHIQTLSFTIRYFENYVVDDKIFCSVKTNDGFAYRLYDYAENTFSDSVLVVETEMLYGIVYPVLPYIEDELINVFVSYGTNESSFANTYFFNGMGAPYALDKNGGGFATTENQFYYTFNFKNGGGAYWFDVELLDVFASFEEIYVPIYKGIPDSGVDEDDVFQGYGKEGNIIKFSFPPGVLTHNKIYKWRIVAYDFNYIDDREEDEQFYTATSEIAEFYTSTIISWSPWQQVVDSETGRLRPATYGDVLTYRRNMLSCPRRLICATQDNKIFYEDR